MTHEKKFAGMDYREKVSRVCDWLREKKGKNITAIDVSGICSVTDAMVLVTAGTVRQAKSLADNVLAKAKEENIEYLGMEGYANGLWILMDLNDVLVHVFQEQERSLYDLEGLWSEGTILEEEQTEISGEG